MERENFYILLELAYDPPETDPEVIEKAISKKQTEWSRLRNHPTKGLHAQKCINMIPEIRRVMKDEALRAKEAEAARELMAKNKESKYPEIDRHIDILMGKGHITKEEKARLATVHGLAENEIQNRINAKKYEKYHRIDQQITLRMAKGYLTESEVEKIAKRNSAKIEEVRQRVRCPVVKTDKAPEVSVPRQLDRSIEKTIHENLKLLNKSSLYEFLGLPESADLKTLQETAARKKKELAQSSKKDAVATAANTLVGQCVTIFKSEQNRISYDISLAGAKLAALDSDINIAGINGKLRPEYFEILVNKAMDFGMEKEEARLYITDYCRRKKLSIEMPPDKRRKYIIASAAAAGIVVIIAVAGAFFYAQHRSQTREAEFAKIMEQVKNTEQPQAKIQLLKTFIGKHGTDDNYRQYIEKAGNRLTEIKETIAEKNYENVRASIGQLSGQGNYRQAIAEYRRYLEKDPPEKYAKKAEAGIKRLKQQLESRDFKRLEQVMINGTPPEKIGAITDYMNAHPKGEHTKDVEKMCSEVNGEYYIYITNKLEACEKEKEWEQCAKLCQNYISLYDNSYADKLRDRLEGYREKIKQRKKLEALRSKAENFGTDYEAAIEMYKDYLAAYPRSPLTEPIQKEIRGLRQKKRQKTIKEASQRFRSLLGKNPDRYVEKTAGVVLDKKTGLMWQLLDTGLTRPEECFTYEKARQYAEKLSTGGYSDWRLPSPEELTGIYKTKPHFPAMDKKWYWTSDSYSSYSDSMQKRKMVSTVDNTPSERPMIERRDSRECGTVRAVRD
ncbi:MAG: DUF1566 domain-containing protein [Desulfobacteraceae bacterium]|nr:DUF1566 domain-containing protein [Desulfobacteraceae bacterium]